MNSRIPEQIKIVEDLKSLLEKAGLMVESTSNSESFSELLLPELGITLGVEWKRIINDTVLLSAGTRANPISPYIRIIATSALSHNAFSRCVESGQNVLDSSGNGVVIVPGFRFERFIASTQPRRLPMSGTPFSARSSRIVRALLSEPHREWSQAELVEATGVTQGYASKCLKILVNQAYIVSSGTHWRVHAPDALLDDWAAHYRFDRHSQHRFALSSPSYDEGLHQLGEKLSRAGIRYAYTGWSGAHLRMPYAIPPKVMIFVESVPKDPKALGLYPVESKENVLLIIPRDEGVYQFGQIVDGLTTVSDPQIYIDLYRLPGRAREQAQVLRSRLINEEKSDHA